jgi:hypothetical protein
VEISHNVDMAGAKLDDIEVSGIIYASLSGTHIYTVSGEEPGPCQIGEGVAFYPQCPLLRGCTGIFIEINSRS